MAVYELEFHVKHARFFGVHNQRENVILGFSLMARKSVDPAKIEFISISELLPYPKNPRTHPKANVDKLAQSLTEYGWTNPVLVTDKLEVIAGHGRLLAAKQLKIATAPCIRLKHLSEAQVRAYRLADNRLGLDSDWDWEALRLELAEIDLDLKLIGFDELELVSILASNGDDPDQEWLGMPEFDQQDKTAFRSIIVHFVDQDAVDKFAELLGAEIPDKAKFIWFPKAEIGVYRDKKYVAK